MKPRFNKYLIPNIYSHRDQCEPRSVGAKCFVYFAPSELKNFFLRNSINISSLVSCNVAFNGFQFAVGRTQGRRRKSNLISSLGR